MRKRCSIQQGEKGSLAVDQSKVLKIDCSLFGGPPGIIMAFCLDTLFQPVKFFSLLATVEKKEKVLTFDIYNRLLH